MAIASNFPSIRPSLLLDFANVGRLDPRVTFARASSGTYYDGVTTAKAEQNLLLQSQDFLTNWNITRLVRTADADTAPDGTVTADSIVQAAGQTSAGVITASPSISAQAGAITVSIFAKPDGKDFIVFRDLHSDGTVNLTWFDVQNGTVGTTDPGHTAVITASTNGYYRCSITYTANAARNADVSFFIADTDGSLTVVDDGNGLYIWGAQFEQRSAVTAYTATTTQSITNYIPVLQTAAAGVPRFDHNPTTGEALGLLIEEQRTNLVTYSEDFANAAWTKSNSSITSNTIIAPDGTLTGDKLVEDATNSNHSARNPVTVVSGSTYTASVYFKAAERTQSSFEIFTGASVYKIIVDLSTGTFVSQTGTGSYVITSVGNGWYRVAITAVASSTTLNTFIYPAVAGSTTYTGDGYSGIYIWGADLEAGAFATSYIPTTTASVTRNADAASMTGTNFSSWFNNAEGSVYVEYDPYFADTNSTKNFTVFSMNDATANNAIQFFRRSVTGNESIFNVRVNSGNFAFINTGTWSANVTKLSCAYQVDDFASVFNAGTVQTDTSGILPVVSQMLIGNDATSNYLNGTIRKLAFYPQRLSDAQLQALTG